MITVKQQPYRAHLIGQPLSPGPLAPVPHGRAVPGRVSYGPDQPSRLFHGKREQNLHSELGSGRGKVRGAGEQEGQLARGAARQNQAEDKNAHG